MENYDEDIPDTMDEIIQESRMRKEEAAREREELERQRGELDEEFSNIFGELSFRPPKAQRPIERVEPDSYDKLMKEMIFDRKATATERVLAEKRFLCMWGKMEVFFSRTSPTSTHQLFALFVTFNLYYINDRIKTHAERGTCVDNMFGLPLGCEMFSTSLLEDTGGITSAKL